MKFDCWFQSPDFSISEHKQQLPGKVVALFINADWEERFALEVQLAKRGEDFCLTEFGITHPLGHQLHLRPNPQTNACWIMYRPSLKRNLLGFIPWPDPEHEVDITISEAEVAIVKFCTEDPHEQLMAFIGKATRNCG